ncbi:CinA family nicotinamide mononucleotide deamidase-related protein [Empedobacter sp. 225-1]|uniref:CinA family nicotinamide mononucleotide deamidase-related protein n=1 Tax=unclassified Empedobacter TaxID=2643773 RepID=UPI0025761EC4|nr:MULTISPECIES: CinA family nicotinamide mononucleotide deamidase-related protein [unclassified Empedobacter]MDM1522180.1 CinA family nicotinamide mononucleotide deamidase-related protein [Empedobacter sp. 225-1]MDM1542437.1 CinA family nicotinamide mononucleotide deamidase-related protein [Empedobacter sp. 189-2]
MQTKATLLTIGDEILIGQIVDTNSAFIAQQLNKIGIEVEEIISVQDELNHIIEAFQRGISTSDIVIVTGGLGPTKDDKTKMALCQFLECELIREEKVIENIIHLFATRGYKKELNNLNQDQALIPEKSTFIQNKYGTAPCLWTTIENKVLINLPGVPFEMKGLMRDEIIPRLKDNFQTDIIVHRDILVSGIPESDLAILVEDWESQLPEFIHLAYLPNRTSIDLRFSATGDDEVVLRNLIQQEIEKFKLIAGKYLVSENSGKAQQVLGDLLKQKDLTISTAESCTGGNISTLITSVSGSSSYFIGSVVSYATSVKTSVLGVNQKDIDQHSVVSEQVAKQMALGACKVLKTNLAVSTTGVAGPNKGKDDNEVGTVWVSVTNGQQTINKKYFYPYLDREDFIKIVSTNALNLVIQFVNQNYQ